MSCLCDSYNFWEFSNGMVTAYSSYHDSETLGAYFPIEDGQYRIEFKEGKGIKEWTVKPSLLFMHILEDDLPRKARLSFVTTLTWRNVLQGRSDEVKRNNLSKKI